MGMKGVALPAAAAAAAAASFDDLDFLALPRWLREIASTSDACILHEALCGGGALEPVDFN